MVEDEAFLHVFKTLGVHGDGPEAGRESNQEQIACMRLHPDRLAEERALLELVLRTHNRPTAEFLIRYFTMVARYLSDLIGGEIPILAPRVVVEASAGLGRPAEADALLIGQAMQRAIQTQIVNRSESMTQAILAEIRQFLGGLDRQAVPVNSKYLDTKQMAARLDLSEVTVARLCGRGQIDADKTAGNQWRTTEERLGKSPYLNNKNGKRRGGGNGRLE